MIKPLIIFSTQGWTDLWVSKHWIANEFAKERLVLFVEPPRRVTPRQLITGKLIEGDVRKIKNNLWVLSTVTFPFPFRVPSLFRPLWRIPIARQFEEALNNLCIFDFDVLNFDPHSMSLIKKNSERVEKNIYYAVDPPLGREDYFWSERRCVKESDSVFAVTPILKDLIVSESGRDDISVLPHGVDYASSQLVDDFTPDPYKEAFKNIASDDIVIGYAGAIHDVCLEEAVVVDAIEKRPDWKFVFVGPYSGSALSKKSLDITRLKSFSNVFFVGAIPYIELKFFINRFDVCIVPYNSKANVNWERRSPFKVLGYLAQGKPVVISRVPAVSYYEGHVFVYERPEDFLAVCETALAWEGGGDARKAFAKLHDFSLLKTVLSKALD